MSLDDLVAAVREVMAKRFPDAEYAGIVFHRPGLPDTVLTVTPPDFVRPRPKETDRDCPCD